MAYFMHNRTTETVLCKSFPIPICNTIKKFACTVVKICLLKFFITASFEVFR